MSQFQRPNNRNHIALAYDTFEPLCLEHEAIKEILSLIKDDNFNMNFTYAIYTDQSFVKENLFLPIFHTYYLNSDKKSVLLLSPETYDMPSIYPHHSYFIYGDKEKTQKDFNELQNAYPKIELKQISSLKELYSQ